MTPDASWEDYEQKLEEIIKQNNITAVVHLTALLSAKAQSFPGLAKRVNVEAVEICINVCKRSGVKTVVIPSSTAVLEKASAEDMQIFLDVLDNKVLK